MAEDHDTLKEFYAGWGNHQAYLVEALSPLTFWQLATGNAAPPLDQCAGRVRHGEMFTFSRRWVIWHLIEHDLHHGGELFFTLDMHG